jgi:plasmid stabilization system protein ParE
MSTYRLTPLARGDIFDIWSYIADDSEEIADRVERAIYDACSFLGEAPQRGHVRCDLIYFFCSGLKRFPPGIGGQPSDVPSISATAFS